MIVKEDPGTARYVVWIDGLAPPNVQPSGPPGIVQINIPISALNDDNMGDTANIPPWIKTNAGWWADGSIDDNSFIQGDPVYDKRGDRKDPHCDRQLTCYLGLI